MAWFPSLWSLHLAGCLRTKLHKQIIKTPRQSTELDEYVRKTVLESEIDSVEEKLRPDKLKVKNSQNFRQIMIFQDLYRVFASVRQPAPKADFSWRGKIFKNIGGAGLDSQD